MEIYLVVESVNCIQDWLIDNPAYRLQKEDEINNLINNIVILSEGNNGHGVEEHTLFTITPLLLED